MDSVRRARTRGPRLGRSSGVRTRGGRCGESMGPIVPMVAVVTDSARGLDAGRHGNILGPKRIGRGASSSGRASRRSHAIYEVSVGGGSNDGAPASSSTFPEEPALVIVGGGSNDAAPARSSDFPEEPVLIIVGGGSNDGAPARSSTFPEEPALVIVGGGSNDGAPASSSTFPEEPALVIVDGGSNDGAPASSSTFPEEPALFLDCGESSTDTSRTPKQQIRSRGRHDADIFSLVNYGSESESDGDDEDEEQVRPIIPRTFLSAIDTPEDDEAAVQDVFVLPAALDPSYQPKNFFDFQWTSFPNPPIPPESRRETFSNTNVGPTAPCVDPYDTFVAIWDQHFMKYIALETNRYAQALAQQMLNSNTLHPGSRICEWRDTCPDELYVYFAILLAMGTVVKSKMEEYWGTTPDIFITPGFSAHMSLRRFQLISRCIHFNDNENMSALELDSFKAKLFKIQPLISHLNMKFQSMYAMTQNIALDESLLQWKGWLGINQFIPNKAAKVGIKTYEICESQTGYLWRFEIHAHKDASQQPQQSNPLDSFTSATVLRLIQGLENKGYTLWMDSFYNSPALARKLKTLGFDCVGTLRTNRQFVPVSLAKLTKENMRPGEIAGFTSGDVDLMVWRDLNRVGTISTYHGNAIVDVNGSLKPILIQEYNIMMGGVDKKDQMLAMYPIERKRTRVWYKKFFRRLLNISVLNSFILVTQSSSSMPHRSFRSSLIKSILKKHACSSDILTIKPASAFYDIKTHYLCEYPLLPSGNSRYRRACVKCKKRGQLYCAGCNKTMCMTPCFVSFHTQ